LFVKKNPKVAIVGAGAMGEALLGALRSGRGGKRIPIAVSAPRVERRKELRAKYQVDVGSNTEIVQGADVVLLCVKPQVARTVLRQIAPHLKREVLLISVAAGIPLELLHSLTGAKRIVRSMPNTPVRIGRGVTVWIANGELARDEKRFTQRLFEGCGTSIEVHDERFLDMVTALSANGPAYVFLFLEALTDVGVHLGLPRHISHQLVFDAVAGSVAYAAANEKHLAALRAEVTSPGGTSAAALAELEAAGFRSAIARAVWAGYRRARELGDN